MREMSLRNTVSTTNRNTVGNSFSPYSLKDKIILEVFTNRGITIGSCISTMKGKEIMEDYEDMNLEDVMTIDEFFEEHANDKSALKYLIGLFLEQTYDMQEFMEDRGYTAEDFMEWKKEKEKMSYH